MASHPLPYHRPTVVVVDTGATLDVIFFIVAAVVSAASSILVALAVVVYVAAFVPVLVFAVVAAVAAVPTASGAAVGHPVGDNEFPPFLLSLWPASSPNGHCQTFPLPPLLLLLLLGAALGPCS